MPTPRAAVFVRMAGVVCTAVLAGAPVPSALSAQPYGSAVSLHGSLGLARYWSDESFHGNGASFAGALQVFPTSLLGFELGVDGGEHSRSLESGVTFDGSAVHVSGNVLIRFARARLQPYLIGGVGVLHAGTVRTEPGEESFESNGVDSMANLGLGAFFFIDRHVSLRPEVRIVGYDDSAPLTHYYRVSVGLGYHL